MTTGKSYELSHSQKTLYLRTFFLTLHRNILISILIIIDIFCFLMYKKGWTYKVQCIWHLSQMLCIYSLIYTLYMAMIKGISMTQQVTSSWVKSSINQIASALCFALPLIFAGGVCCHFASIDYGGTTNSLKFSPTAAGYDNTFHLIQIVVEMLVECNCLWVRHDRNT